MQEEEVAPALAHHRPPFGTAARSQPVDRVGLCVHSKPEGTPRGVAAGGVPSLVLPLAGAAAAAFGRGLLLALLSLLPLLSLLSLLTRARDAKLVRDFLDARRTLSQSMSKSSSLCFAAALLSATLLSATALAAAAALAAGLLSAAATLATAAALLSTTLTTAATLAATAALLAAAATLLPAALAAPALGGRRTVVLWIRHSSPPRVWRRQTREQSTCRHESTRW